MAEMVFLKVCWMKHYEGLKDDTIQGADRFVKKEGYGHEIFNYVRWKGQFYGFVQANQYNRIAIENLGASKADESVSNILAVWVSACPSGGVYVIGWYKNATVYRDKQPAPEGSHRKYRGEMFGYSAMANASDCTLLPVDKRVLRVPKRKMGQAHIWYAKDREHDAFRRKVLALVCEGAFPHRRGGSRKGIARSADPQRRKRIEASAVAMVTSYYGEIGYTVDSVEKDNVGWDLEARMEDLLLRIEVKGLSQTDVAIELTPNEYAKMQKHRDSYRIAVVTQALTKRPTLAIFSFSPESGQWEDDCWHQLTIEEVTGARLSSR